MLFTEYMEAGILMAGADMLVKLYDLEEQPELYAGLKEQGILVKRVMAADSDLVLQFVKSNWNDSWAHECAYALSNHPISCFIAVKDKKVIGFACYDASAKNFFGPTGVDEQYRNRKIGMALMLKCLFSMKSDGYGYAIIGWVDDAVEFYEKTVHASVIEHSFPGIYRSLIMIE